MRDPAITAALAILLLAMGAQARSAEPDEEALRVPPEVTLHKKLDRIVFADARGMVLYTYDKDKDTPGTSACVIQERHCPRRWPPLLAPANALPVGLWAPITRPDGAKQWAYKGMPVYRSVDDVTPGTESGDNGQGGTFHTLKIDLPPPRIPMPARFAFQPSEEAWIFVDHRGSAIYAPEVGSAGFNCDTACIQRWAPLPAPLLARPIGDWKPVPRSDGTLQWTYQDRPLFTLRDGEQAPDTEAASSLRPLQYEEEPRSSAVAAR